MIPRKVYCYLDDSELVELTNLAQQRFGGRLVEPTTLNLPIPVTYPCVFAVCQEYVGGKGFPQGERDGNNCYFWSEKTEIGRKLKVNITGAPQSVKFSS